MPEPYRPSPRIRVPARCLHVGADRMTRAAAVFKAGRATVAKIIFRLSIPMAPSNRKSGNRCDWCP